MTREEVIRDNPLVDYLERRGVHFRRSGANLVTNSCPLENHKPGHLCVTVDPQKELWNCDDHNTGGTVIDWMMKEQNLSFIDAIHALSGAAMAPRIDRNALGVSGQRTENKINPTSSSREIEAIYDYLLS